MKGIRHWCWTRRWLACLLGVVWSASLLAVPAEPKPNILLIVVDDLGLGDLRSFHPAAKDRTPNIDALAAQGMRFTRFYTDSTCSASRAALLTGQSPARLGFHPVARGVDPDAVTLPEYLKTLGYNTHFIGKWHIGELDAAAKPVAQGFDSSFGFMNQWFLQGPDAEGRPQMRAPVYENPWLETGNGDWREYPGYLPDVLTEHAVAQIRQLAADRQPWFMWYATPLVHGPLHRPPGTTAADDDGKYRDMISQLDRNIGQLLQALDSSGQRSNTLVILLSDNGAPEKRQGSNAGYSGGKAHYSEGAVRTPMIWVDPGRTEPGSLDERAVQIADIFPSIAGRLGHPLPFATDGIDIHDLKNFAAVNQRPWFWLSRGSYSMLSADKLWRLTEEWVFREKQRLFLWKVTDDVSEEAGWWRYFHWLPVMGMQRELVKWLDDVTRTHVQWHVAGGMRSASGNDFLRTPLREWDFYMAATSTAIATAEPQVLAEQPGIWSMTYLSSTKQLRVEMHGHRWEVPLVFPSGCFMIGLNADLYDRYTNVSEQQYPTELRLSLNGVEVARTEWQIESMAGLPVHNPTTLGAASDGSSPWQGILSQPAFFHRANIVGEWPFFIDDGALQQELCGRLE